LKVVAPASAADAKGLLIAAIRDDNPVIFMEHRWLHNTFGPVSEASEEVPIGKAKIVHTGKDVTVVATSHMVIEAMRAADVLEKQGISAEIIDLRTIRPIDTESIVASVSKTGHLIVADDDWATCGVSAEILALCSERIHAKIKRNPVRVTPPDFPSPTSLSLSEHYYPRAISIVNLARAQFDLDPVTEEAVGLLSEKMHDVADSSFLGPF